MKIVLISLGLVFFGYLAYTAFILPSPLAQDKRISTASNATPELALSQLASGKGELTYKIVRKPEHGSVSLFGSIAMYTPTVCYDGTDSFSYGVRDIPLLPWRKTTGDIIVTVTNPELTYRVNVEINVERFKPCGDSCLSSQEKCDWDTGPGCLPLPDPHHKPDILANLNFAGRERTISEKENVFEARHSFNGIELKLCDTIDIEVLNVNVSGAEEIGTWQGAFEGKSFTVEAGLAQITFTFEPEM